MKLTKAQREELKQKYDGHCAYCGDRLGDKWHADHLEAVVRDLVIGKPEKPENDVYENLMPALQLGTIVNHQTYGVTFFAKIKKDTGEEGLVERGFRIDTPMKLSEFINGYEDCYVNKGHGLKVKGWKGAKEEWLSMMDEEFHNDTCLDAWAVANCLVRAKA
ncbi:hypothetical protein [Acinetobacter haemolyticus]|uniref:hypothetical protein n=1 Tax=Acinetobacter haemolyticus TaxID=29430 RepID=UPI0009492AEF|nr:hypothetical protein [Acinetobacter haemolyticus]APR70750.1 hypothetical protein AHTJS_10465 [Acinetobacter haemolyticus]